MSTNLLIALILLPGLGALIAWAGDVIGYRLGKSRRSLFGLRPRTTARLVGAAVGAALPLAGLLFAMAVSQDARDAVLHISDLQKRAVELGQQNDLLRTATEHAFRDAQQAGDRARTAEAHRVEAAGRLQRTESEMRASSQRLDVAQASLRNAVAALGSTKGELARARENVTQARENLAQAQTNLAEAKSGLEQAQAASAQAQQELAQSQAQLAASAKELMGLQAEVQSVQAEVSTLPTLQRQAEVVKQDLENTQRLVEHYAQQLDAYKLAQQAIVTGKVAFEPGKEIVRYFVDASRSQDQLETILNGMLLRADASAVREDIAAGPNGRAVRVVSPMPPGVAPNKVTEAEIVSNVASQIRQGDAPTYVVIVRAWGRTFKQQAEQMPVEFWVAPNRVVFGEGEVLLTKRIDGGKPRAVVFTAVWQMLGAIRTATADRGVLPDPESGHYGEVPAEEILDALDHILDMKGEAVVRAVAASEARVAQPTDQPLLVHLTVEKAPE